MNCADAGWTCCPDVCWTHCSYASGRWSGRTERRRVGGSRVRASGRAVETAAAHTGTWRAAAPCNPRMGRAAPADNTGTRTASTCTPASTGAATTSKSAATSRRKGQSGT